MFDSHFHLIQLPQPFQVAKQLIKIGYCGEICACNEAEWHEQRKLCEEIKRFIGFYFFEEAYGVHPMFAKRATESSFETLRLLLQKFPGIRIGECGLDKRFDGYEKGGAQEEALRKQVQLAVEFGRDITFHIVGDHRRVFTILKEEGVKASSKLYFHRFGGDREAVALALAYDSTFGNPRKPECVPKERIRTETDADSRFCKVNTPASDIANMLVDSLNNANRMFTL